MTGLAVIRILLVIALMITAHIIKPFSFSNVTTHLLSTARSFSSVLPESAATSLAHANYLAAALGVSAREHLDSAIPTWDKPLLVEHDQANWHLASWQESARADKKGWAAKRPGALKRRAHAVKGGLIAARRARPVRLPAVPTFTEAMIVSLPVVHSFAHSLAIHVMQEVETISVALAARLSDCEPRPVTSFRLVAVGQEQGQLKFVAAAKPKAADCNPVPTIIEAATKEVTTGPEEAQEAFEQAVESHAATIQAVETQASESIAKPAEYCPLKP